jgi:WD40 repeat protein
MPIPWGSWLWRRTAHGFDRAARLWNLEAANPAAGCAVLGGHSGPLQEAVFSPDGHWLVSLAADGTVRLWDLKTIKKG